MQYWYGREKKVGTDYPIEINTTTTEKKAVSALEEKHPWSNPLKGSGEAHPSDICAGG